MLSQADVQNYQIGQGCLQGDTRCLLGLVGLNAIPLTRQHVRVICGNGWFVFDNNNAAFQPGSPFFKRYVSEIFAAANAKSLWATIVVAQRAGRMRYLMLSKV